MSNDTFEAIACDWEPAMQVSILYCKFKYFIPTKVEFKPIQFTI